MNPLRHLAGVSARQFQKKIVGLTLNFVRWPNEPNSKVGATDTQEQELEGHAIEVWKAGRERRMNERERGPEPGF
jgi:hypothetical protein